MVYCWRKENDKKKKKENGGRNLNWNSISDDLNCNLQLLGKKKGAHILYWIMEPDPLHN